MDPQKPFVYLGYLLSGFLFVCGIVVAAGFFMPPTMPSRVRVMFGVVMLLYGVYRFVNIRMKQQQRDEDRFLS